MTDRHKTAIALVNEIAKQVSTRRQANGWTLDHLAERAGMSKSYIWALEKGDAANPTIDTALRLSRALACSMDELCGIRGSDLNLHPEARRIALEIDALLRKKQGRKGAQQR